MSTYVFDTRSQHELGRLRSLEAIYDPATIRYLATLGVAEGWRCLEVGCGAGGAAFWLARKVGKTGHVVATDLDTRFIDRHRHDHLEVRRHDILAEPLEAGSFDLAHARALIEHLPRRREALERMISAVRSGGWLLIEDVDCGGAMAPALAQYFRPVEHRALFERVYRAADAVFSAAGSSATFGSELAAMLVEAGLENVGAEIHGPVIAGGTEDWARGTIEQLAPRLAGTGLVTPEDLRLFLALAKDRATQYPPPLMVSAWGRRPGIA